MFSSNECFPCFGVCLLILFSGGLFCCLGACLCRDQGLVLSFWLCLDFLARVCRDFAESGRVAGFLGLSPARSGSGPDQAWSDFGSGFNLAKWVGLVVGQSG